MIAEFERVGVSRSRKYRTEILFFRNTMIVKSTRGCLLKIWFFYLVTIFPCLSSGLLCHGFYLFAFYVLPLAFYLASGLPIGLIFCFTFVILPCFAFCLDFYLMPCLAFFLASHWSCLALCPSYLPFPSLWPYLSHSFLYSHPLFLCHTPLLLFCLCVSFFFACYVNYGLDYCLSFELFPNLFSFIFSSCIVSCIALS